LFPFLGIGETFAVFHEEGNTPLEYERWNKFLKGFAIAAAVFFRTSAGRQSGPADLLESKFTKILYTALVRKYILDICVFASGIWGGNCEESHKVELVANFFAKVLALSREFLILSPEFSSIKSGKEDSQKFCLTAFANDQKERSFVGKLSILRLIFWLNKKR